MNLCALCVVAALAGGHAGSGNHVATPRGLEEISLVITGESGVEVALIDARGRACGWAEGKRIDKKPNAFLSLNWDYTIPMDVGEPDTTLLKDAAKGSIDDEAKRTTPPLVYEFRLIAEPGAKALPSSGEYTIRMRGNARDSVSVQVSSRATAGDECAADVGTRLKDGKWRRWRLSWRVVRSKCLLDLTEEQSHPSHVRSR